MATMMERPMFSAPSEKPKSESELAAEQLERQEQEALMQWADIIDVAKKNGIDLENALDPRESDPSYKGLKEHLLKMKDETLKILFELDNTKEAFRRKGFTFDA